MSYKKTKGPPGDKVRIPKEDVAKMFKYVEQLQNNYIGTKRNKEFYDKLEKFRLSLRTMENEHNKRKAREKKLAMFKNVEKKILSVSMIAKQ